MDIYIYTYTVQKGALYTNAPSNHVYEGFQTEKYKYNFEVFFAIFVELFFVFSFKET